MISTLEIGNVIVPTKSILTFDQDYEDLGGRDFRRLADGSGVLRSTWQDKIATVISGTGWAPSAFENLNVGSVYVLKCAMIRSASSNTNTVTLPASRRAGGDHDPIGFAVVGDELVETPISGIVADVATLDAVAGAVGYRVHYWPQITAVITRNTCRGQSSAAFTWTIEAEEV